MHPKHLTEISPPGSAESPVHPDVQKAVGAMQSKIEGMSKEDLHHTLLKFYEYFLTVARDRSLVQELLDRERNFDHKTGLLSAVGFRAALKDELRRASRMQEQGVVLEGDVDGLKRINDTRGEAGGDAYITETARLIQAGSRPATDRFGRYGKKADEFMALLPIAAEDAEAVMMTYWRKLQRRMSIGGVVYHFTREGENLVLTLTPVPHPALSRPRSHLKQVTDRLRDAISGIGPHRSHAEQERTYLINPRDLEEMLDRICDDLMMMAESEMQLDKVRRGARRVAAATSEG